MSLLESVPMFDVPMVLPDDSPRVRRNDPVTSHEAADSNDFTRSQRIVFDLFRWVGPFGMTQSWAEANLQPQLSPSRIRSAFSELEALGKVRRTDEYRKTPSGRRAQVWELSND